MPAHLLDEIAIAPADALTAAIPEIARLVPSKVGTIVEYEFQRRHNRSELPQLSHHSDSRILQRIERLISGEIDAQSLSLQPTDADAVRIPVGLGAHAAWTAFVKRAEVSARSLGFDSLVAAGFAGAIGELADNVVRHSESIEPGIAAFSSHSGRFEYVVADAGVGMLASLRRAPEFRSLQDDLEALPLAITPGVSSRGRNSGYGYGYRAVFGPIRVASGTVRLRSGRAVLQVSGYGPSPDNARCAQRPHQQGVVVAVEVIPQAQPVRT